MRVFTYMSEQLLWGFVQGMTEFLPVSSSAHLVFLSHWLMPPENFDRLCFFTGLHFGTLLALLFFFRSEIIDLIKRATEKDKKAWRFILNIGVVTLITGILGLSLEGWADLFSGQPRTTAGILFAMGLALLSSRFLGSPSGRSVFSIRHAVLLGIIQGLAVLPGISRSGSTILTLLLLGFDPREAFRISFLTGIPIIFLAFVHESIGVAFGNILYIVPSMFFSFVFGMIALSMLKRVVVANRLYLFGLYCIGLASLVCILIPR